MSEMFQKACYMYRSPGYKFRTSSTNTGIKNQTKISKEQNDFLDGKLKLLKNDIQIRIENEADRAQEARDNIQVKFEKVSAKIDSILSLQNAVSTLRNGLRNIEDQITELSDRVDRIEMYLDCGSQNGEIMKEYNPLVIAASHDTDVDSY